MTAPSDALLPCPFCGAGRAKTSHSNHRLWFVHCLGCGTSTQSKTTSELAAEQWNRRAPLDEPAAHLVCDAVEERIRKLVAVAKAYEQWEADLIMCNAAWDGTTPRIPQDLWDRLIEIQAMRNAALGVGQ